MKTKVTIIGAGAVGSTTAYALLAADAAQEIVLIDINTDKADGEALDLVQATPFLGNSTIYSGSYQDAAGSDIVIIASGVGRKPGQTRLELAQINVNILKSVSTEIVKYAPNATYILVANPVDVLTYAFIKFTGLPRNKVFGTGTVLDTIRLRTKLSQIYSVNPEQVHANVLGEHGDSSFAAWSTATVAGVPLQEYGALTGTPDFDKDEVTTYVKKSGGYIIQRKGCTVYGIATSTMHIVKCMSGNADSVLTVSSYLDGEYGLKDVCLSVPTLISHDGVKAVLPQKLSEEEVEKLKASAAALKAVIDGVQF